MEDSEETAKPVAPPRRKKRNYESVPKKEASPQVAEPRPSTSEQPPVKADSPATPKRPPRPRPRVSVGTQEDKTKPSNGNPLKLEAQSKQDKQPSARPTVVPRISSTSPDHHSDKTEVVRPASCSPIPPSRPPPELARPKSSLSNHEHAKSNNKTSKRRTSNTPRSSTPTLDRRHSRPSLPASRTPGGSIITSPYCTIRKGSTYRSISEPNEESSKVKSATVVDSKRYLNVAPRHPPQRWHTPLKASKSDAQYGQKTNKANKAQSSPVTKPHSLHISSQSPHNQSQPIGSSGKQQTKPAKRLTKPAKRLSKPARPAPPDPNKVAHYAIYTEIGPKRVPSVSQDDCAYSYVSVTPRYSMRPAVPKSIEGLDLEVGSCQYGYTRPRTDSTDSYVNSDLNGPPTGPAASSLKENMYMSLDNSTLLDTKDDIYVTPTQNHAHRKVRHVSLDGESSGLVLDTDDNYMCPNDAHHPLTTSDDLYMSLSHRTMEELSIYQQPTLLTRT